MERPNDQPLVNSKVKLMCSYGGKIQPRLSNTNQLTYHGGDTKILTVERNIKFSDIVLKLASLCSIVGEFSVKYQLPGHGLDSLISVMDDDDVDHMVFEYDHILKDPTRSSRMRLFLFGVRKEPEKNSGSGFLINPDYLFGFDKEFELVTESVSTMHTSPITPAGIIVPGFSGYNYGTANKDSNDEVAHGTRDGHVSGGAYVYRVPGPVGGGRGGIYAVPGMVNWEQPVYGILPGAASVHDQKE